jgi:hypothetical protein
VLGKIVTEFSKGDDFADWGIGCRCNLDEIETAVLSFAQSVG